MWTRCSPRRASKARICRKPGAWCWSATRSRPAIPSPRPTAQWCARFGASSRISSAARRRSPDRKDDEKATSPGDVLRELFVEYGPCLILVDEWVAYARQLHDQSDLPAGSFETHVHVRSGAHRVGQAGEELLAGRSRCRRRTRQARHTSRPTTWKWAAFEGAKRSTVCATWWAGSNRPGGRLRPKKASRSCGGGCSSRSRGADAVQAARRDCARVRRSVSRAQAPSFRPSARAATTRSASRRHTRSIRRSSTGSIRTGRRW